MSRKIPGIFVPVDVNLASDGEIIRAGATAELLYRRGLEHVKKANRDGIIYHAELGDFTRGIASPAKQAAALVHVGLWVDNGDSWLVKGWLKWNLSLAEQEAERERKRIGAMKTNHSKGRHGTPQEGCPDCLEKAL